MYLGQYKKPAFDDVRRHALDLLRAPNLTSKCQEKPGLSEGKLGTSSFVGTSCFFSTLRRHADADRHYAGVIASDVLISYINAGNSGQFK